MRTFCLKHRIELEEESHSGALYCSECKGYPFVHQTYEVPESNEVVYRYPNGYTIIIQLDQLIEMRDNRHLVFEEE